MYYEFLNKSITYIHKGNENLKVNFYELNQVKIHVHDVA